MKFYPDGTYRLARIIKGKGITLFKQGSDEFLVKWSDIKSIELEDSLNPLNLFLRGLPAKIKIYKKPKVLRTYIKTASFRALIYSYMVQTGLFQNPENEGGKTVVRRLRKGEKRKKTFWYG